MAMNMQSRFEVDEKPIDRLRSRYLEQGFNFIVNPRSDDLPSFFGGYRPDAVALKPGQNVAIQFMRHRIDSPARSMDEIRRLFVGHADWRLVVSHGELDPLMSDALPAASEASIRSQLTELRELGRQGQNRAAFVLAWSLLEAAFHRLDEDGSRRPRKPGTVLESLARLGYLAPELETRLRSLVLLRNRIVHGDISAQPTANDLDAVFEAIDEALA